MMMRVWRTVGHMFGQFKPCVSTLSAVCLLTRLVHPVTGGDCWETINSDGGCESLYRRNMSQEDCCQNGGANMAWTSNEVPPGQMFLWIALGSGVPNCQRCHDTCTNVQCGSNKRCRIRRGNPRCVCAPDCSGIRHRHRSWVCATNGQSFRSHCSLLRYNCRHNIDYTVDYYGKCQRSCQTVECGRDLYCMEDQDGLPHCIPCQMNCPPNDNEASKVCGADGVTYDSFCHLMAASCLRGRSIGKAYSGPCRGLTCADLACPPGRQCLEDDVSGFPRCVQCTNLRRCLLMMPARQICGSDNNTYNSYCAMRDYSCHVGRAITTKHSGSCDESPLGPVESSFSESETFSNADS